MKKPNLMWFSHFIPYPPVGGCFQRSYNLIKEASRNFNIFLVACRHKTTTHPECNLDESKNKLLDICREVSFVDISGRTSGNIPYFLAIINLLRPRSMTLDLFNSAKIKKTLSALIQKQPFDLVHFDTISLAVYHDFFPDIPRVLNHHGPESYMIRRRIANEKNYLYRLFFQYEYMKLKRDEKIYCPRFQLNTVVSAYDKDILGEAIPGVTFKVIENGVDVDFFYHLYDNKKVNRRIIFAGRLDQYSNKDAVLNFCQKYWPLLKSRVENIKFTIIGINPPQELIALARQDSQIELKGFQKDVRPLFATASAHICPIRDGGGTRIKILDALSMGMPIISTEIGCEGIDVTPGKDILIANSPEQFLFQIARVFSDENLRERLSMNARSTAVEKYSWGNIGSKMNQYYNSLVAAR